MDFYALAGRALVLLLVLYGVSVPAVIAWSVLERRAAGRRDRARRASPWTEV